MERPKRVAAQESNRARRAGLEEGIRQEQTNIINRRQQRSDATLKQKSQDVQEKILRRMQQRKERQEKTGRQQGSKRTKAPKGPYIPWIPYEYTFGGKARLTNLSTYGHNRKKYVSKWFAADTKVPGVYVRRNNGNLRGVPYAVYSGGMYIVNSTGANTNLLKNIYITNRNFNLNGSTVSSRTKKLAKPSLTGPSVKDLSAFLATITDKDELSDIYSYKLIGDRATATECKKLNTTLNRSVVQPFNNFFASLIETFAWSNDQEERQELTKILIKSRENYKPFYYDRGVVYTGDRPLYLYCVKNNIPCILELKGGYTLHLGNNSYKENFRKFVETNSNSGKNYIIGAKEKVTPDHFKAVLEMLDSTSHNKINIFDALHDFAGARSLVGLAKAKSHLKQIYPTEEVFIDKFISADFVKGCENVMSAFVDTCKTKSGFHIIHTKNLFVETKQELIDLFKTYPFYDSCIFYDAGSAIPDELVFRTAVTTQRSTNGWQTTPSKIYANEIKNIMEKYQQSGLFRKFTNIPNMPKQAPPDFNASNAENMEVENI